MPELPEVESYRLLADRLALGRAIARVEAPDDWYLKRGLTRTEAEVALAGQSLSAARRRGKLLLLDTAGPAGDPGAVLGVHFGMSGRLVIDGHSSIEGLLYAPTALDPRYDRFGLVFVDGGALRVSDPRRLGGVELDPDENRLGPDAMTITLGQLQHALGRSHAPLKARLMDQAQVAGVGNLLADEILWRAGLSPTRPAGGLSPAELRRLHRHLRTGLQDLTARGGSHTGDLMVERVAGGHCPKDGVALTHATVGGRSTWWCPRHQG